MLYLRLLRGGAGAEAAHMRAVRYDDFAADDILMQLPRSRRAGCLFAACMP